MSNKMDWETVWQELKSNLEKQPRCEEHPEYPYVKTLSEEVINDIVEIEEEGITIRSHESENERFIRKSLFRIWWNHLIATGSASLNQEDPDNPSTSHSRIVGAIMATCLNSKIKIAGPNKIKLIQSDKEILQTTEGIERKKASTSFKNGDIPEIPEKDLIEQKEFLVAEYNTLRKEIMNKYNTKTAILVMTNTIVGIILGYSIKESIYYGFLVLSFVLPIFGMINLYCDYTISKIGNYIFERFNKNISAFYWETYVRKQRKTKRNPYRYKFTFRVPAIILFIVFPLSLLASYMVFFSEPTLLEIFLSIVNLILILWVIAGFVSLQKLRGGESLFSH